MFGIFALAFQILFVIFPLLGCVPFLVSIRKYRTSLRPWLGLVMSILITIMWLPVLGAQLYHESADYLFLAMLAPENVSSIKVGEATWDNPTEIRKITAVLNHPVWHVPNHDIGGPIEPMIVTMRSGQTMSFRVGRYYGRDGALIEFYRPNGTGSWEDGNTFIPGLTTIFDSLGHPLPAREN